MYVVQSSACTVANGSDPVTPATIAAGLANIAALNGPANLAQSTFDALVTRTDLNTNGWPLATNGGTPAGPAGQAAGTPPTGGRTTPLRYWPSGERSSKRTCIATVIPPMGANPASLQATSAPPAPPMTSLVTQGHPSYSPATKATAAAPSKAGQLLRFCDTMECNANPTFLAGPSGMGCAEGDSFWPGLISGISLLASGLVLYEWLKKNGGGF